MGRMEKTGITPHHNDCFYEARCCLLPRCCVWSGSGSLLTHYPRHEVGGPSLEHCQWSQQHTNTDSSIHQQQSRHNSQHSAMCSVSSNMCASEHRLTCSSLRLVSSDQHFPENCDDASVCTLFRNGVGMHYWRYQVTLTTITQSCSVSGDCFVSVAGGG